MPRKSASATTGKERTDPPPYFLHPKLPPFDASSSPPIDTYQPIYNLMAAAGFGLLSRLQHIIAPKFGRRSLALAYNAGAINNKSSREAINLPVERKIGIGPVRMVYYRELVYGHHYQSMLEDTYLAGTSYFVAGGKRRDPDEWLTMDRFYAKTLMSLGLSWWCIEQAIVTGFLKSHLPAEFMEQYDADPTSTSFVAAWEEVWSNRKKFQDYGNRSRKFRANIRQFEKQGKTAEDVEAILQGTANDLRTEGEILYDADGIIIIPLDNAGRIKIPSSAEDHVLNEILIPGLSLDNGGSRAAAAEQILSGQLMRDYGFHKILLNSRDLTQNRTEDFAAYATDRRSPFINSIVYELGQFIWDSIDIKRRYPASPAARHLMERKTAWLEQGDQAELHYFLPTEFYMLIADILYHCPVASGLPDNHLIRGSTGPPEEIELWRYSAETLPPVKPPPPMWEGLTADQVRQRFGEAVKANKPKKQRRNQDRQQ